MKPDHTIPHLYDMSGARIKLTDIVNDACHNNIVSTVRSSHGRTVAVIPYHMLQELQTLRAAQHAKASAFTTEQLAAHKALHKAVQEYAAQFPSDGMRSMLVTRQGKE